MDTIDFGNNNFPAPNALVFDDSGNFFISYSFQGAIFKISNGASCAKPCSVDTLVHDGLLATASFRLLVLTVLL
jgi:hypothetical protein